MAAVGTSNGASWAVPEAERQAHLRTFAQLKPVDGQLAGANARACLLKSKLPQDELAHIW